MKNRACGLLMHLTSLPSNHGVGDLGPEAHRFVDFLADAGQRFWQILPLNPTDTAYDSSPYHSISAFAFNPLLISLDRLVDRGLLSKDDLKNPPSGKKHRVEFMSVTAWKMDLLEKAFKKAKDNGQFSAMQATCETNRYWLDDFALFKVIKSSHEYKSWVEWPASLRDRVKSALEEFAGRNRESVEREKFYQCLFIEQWFDLKKYANNKGIQIIGDIPIYVDHDSVDVWTHPHLFKLDHAKKPVAVAGVPPDYFSATGQLWGNPVYDWDVLKSEGFSWWVQRVRHNASFFNCVRIDHFRGLVAYWEVPASEKTAVNGQWINAPIYEFLNILTSNGTKLPLIAEDLGHITPDVFEVMKHFQLPGMRVLQFGFSEELQSNPHAFHNHVPETIVYTGTHDNNTTRGWFEEEVSAGDKRRFLAYMDREIEPATVSWEMIRLAMMSPSKICIIPFQDLLCLDSAYRMNTPGTGEGNWKWRATEGQLTPEIGNKLKELCEVYGRLGKGGPLPAMPGR